MENKNNAPNDESPTTIQYQIKVVRDTLYEKNEREREKKLTRENFIYFKTFD